MSIPPNENPPAPDAPSDFIRDIVAAHVADRSLGGSDRALLEIQEPDAGARAREALGDRQADPARASGDDRDLPRPVPPLHPTLAIR